MTGKRILGITLEDPCTHLQESIGDYIRDVIDESLCEEVYDQIWEARGLTEKTAETYDFYDDPIWKEAWNKKVDEMVTALKL